MSVLKRIVSLFRKKVTKSVSSAESSTKKARSQQAKVKTSKNTRKFKPLQFTFLKDAFSMIHGMRNSWYRIPGLDASGHQARPSYEQPTHLGRRERRRLRGNAKHSSTPWESILFVKKEVHKPWNNPKGHRHVPSCHQSWMDEDESGGNNVLTETQGEA